jgi:transposase
VLARWDEGVHNIQQIWREIKALGYPHSDRALRAHLEALRGKKQAEVPEACLLDHFSAKKAVWLFMRPFEKLKENEREELLTLLQTSSMAQTMYQLVREFLRIVHALQGEQLDTWIAKVAASQIKELQRFAKGLERDKAAVLAGLTRSHNNGQALHSYASAFSIVSNI